jgi:hypothetical protein
VSNHHVTIEGDVVRKRYRRTSRGEPVREWAALVLLDEHVPGLAPRPVAFEPEPPVVVMSRIPGEPLDRVLTPELLSAMLEAYRLLFAVPVHPDTPRRYWHPEAFLRNNAEWIEAERTRTDVPDVVRRDGARVRLIDFEGFGVGDLAFEVADLAEHVSARLGGLRDPGALIAGFDLDPARLLLSMF